MIENDEDHLGFTVNPNESDLTHFTATFPGVRDTPYEGGTFVVDFQVPSEYPLKPPKVKFETPIYHPNVSSQTGAICLDILKDKWIPTYGIKQILISLQQLLDDPNANDPQDAEVARVFNEDRPRFVQTAREWTRKHAMSSKPAEKQIDPATLAKFTGMGFSEDKVRQALKGLGLTKVSNEEQSNKVIEQLLG